MLGIGDGDLPDGGIQERLQAGSQVELRVIGYPNYDFSTRVLIKRARFD